MTIVEQAMRKAVILPTPRRAARTFVEVESVRVSVKFSVTQAGDKEGDLTRRDRRARRGALGIAVPWTGVEGGVEDDLCRNKSCNSGGN